MPLGEADVKRPGADVTLIAYGRQVHDCLAAATQLEGEVDVEVLEARDGGMLPYAGDGRLPASGPVGDPIVLDGAVCEDGFEGKARDQEVGRGQRHPGQIQGRPQPCAVSNPGQA